MMKKILMTTVLASAFLAPFMAGASADDATLVQEAIQMGASSVSAPAVPTLADDVVAESSDLSCSDAQPSAVSMEVPEVIAEQTATVLGQTSTSTIDNLPLAEVQVEGQSEEVSAPSSAEGAASSIAVSDSMAAVSDEIKTESSEVESSSATSGSLDAPAENLDEVGSSSQESQSEETKIDL